MLLKQQHHRATNYLPTNTYLAKNTHLLSKRTINSELLSVAYDPEGIWAIVGSRWNLGTRSSSRLPYWLGQLDQNAPSCSKAPPTHGAKALLLFTGEYFTRLASMKSNHELTKTSRKIAFFKSLRVRVPDTDDADQSKALIG